MIFFFVSFCITSLYNYIKKKYSCLKKNSSFLLDHGMEWCRICFEILDNVAHSGTAKAFYFSSSLFTDGPNSKSCNKSYIWSSSSSSKKANHIMQHLPAEIQFWCKLIILYQIRNMYLSSRMCLNFQKLSLNETLWFQFVAQQMKRL